MAIGPRGLHAIVSNPSYSQEVAKQKALALWYSNWHGQARILASTGVVGECAVAFWRQGNRWAIGVALGKRSESEADGPAMKYCLQHCPLGARRNYKVADDETREIFQ